VAIVEWEAVARAETHPLRLRIIEHAVARPAARFSASELAINFAEPLGNVSYHLRALHGNGLLDRAGQRTVRGAIQRYYRAAPVLFTP
jgi:DNA-binding transcriptional ArsR family regulator